MTTTSPTTPLSDQQVQTHAEPINRLVDAVGTIVVGQEHMVRSLVIGLLTGGHVLLEGVPGLAKTLTVTTLAQALHAKFARVQFTPDLLPADLIGTQIYSPKDGTFSARKGPIFANIVLADEINRAPARTQSALLEGMQERHVTIDGVTRPLPRPHCVLATQNPIEHEGTHPLPEAALDRFFFRLHVPYPDEEYEIQVLDRHLEGLHGAEEHLGDVAPVLEGATLATVREEIAAVRVAPEIRAYVVRLARASRAEAAVRLGVSPRASIVLMTAARARAACAGRDWVEPDDVRELLEPAWAHRLILDPEAWIDGATADEVTRRLLERVEVPT